jgi:acylphosphatase
MKIAHVTITGNVHGVGFRQFVKQHAQKFGILGWVQNNDDKTVECMLQGDEESVKKMIELLQVGPMLAEIKHVEVNYMEDPFTFTEFEIVDGNREME